ncbi:hypothetical protein Trydic_g18003 [Trypoxylus dichotomus]
MLQMYEQNWWEPRTVALPIAVGHQFCCGAYCVKIACQPGCAAAATAANRTRPIEYYGQILDLANIVENDDCKGFSLRTTSLTTEFFQTNAYTATYTNWYVSENTLEDVLGNLNHKPDMKRRSRTYQIRTMCPE